jgi:DNA polymerase I
MAFLSYQLATIKIDVPLDIGLEDLHLKAPDCEKLIELYTELEFKSWIDEVEREAKRARAQG